MKYLFLISFLIMSSAALSASNEQVLSDEALKVAQILTTPAIQPEVNSFTANTYSVISIKQIKVNSQTQIFSFFGRAGNDHMDCGKTQLDVIETQAHIPGAPPSYTYPVYKAAVTLNVTHDHGCK